MPTWAVTANQETIGRHPIIQPLPLLHRSPAQLARGFEKGSRRIGLMGFSSNRAILRSGTAPRAPKSAIHAENEVTRDSRAASGASARARARDDSKAEGYPPQEGRAA